MVIPIATLPAGTPADAETLAAINATWREFIACINAGDQARMFALYSDDMVRRQFVVDIAFGVTEEALFEFLAATPVPQTGEWAAVFVPLEDARVLSDQRVAVVQTYEEAPDEVRIFVKEGDRWLVDEGYELS